MKLYSDIFSSQCRTGGLTCCILSKISDTVWVIPYWSFITIKFGIRPSITGGYGMLVDENALEITADVARECWLLARVWKCLDAKLLYRRTQVYFGRCTLAGCVYTDILKFVDAIFRRILISKYPFPLVSVRLHWHSEIRRCGI